ncbi:MAG: substrate-binding domain-containing protein [Oscillospiraceae bacterium]|nr:substrate-binding domain-containing protein [Oscillospiraceae bacterium]
MKTVKQIITLLLVTVIFLSFDWCIYSFYTKRCISDYSKGMQAKSIETDKYLPFTEDSEIVKYDSSVKLSGDLPVLDGATALYPVYSAFFNAVYPETAYEYGPDGFSKDSCLQLNNTLGAYKGIVDGSDDIVFCAKPSEKQLQYAHDNGVQLEMVPIGYEAFVFIVNKNNPVDDLSTDQIKGIYSGKYINWSDVGGPDKLINPVTRKEGSGSQTAMLSFMSDQKIKKSPLAFLGRSIGFSYRYYVEGIVEDSQIKMLKLNGVYPDKSSIQDGSYPIIGNLYAVYRKDNKNENIRKLIDWILSDEGQTIVEESGYVRLK